MFSKPAIASSRGLSIVEVMVGLVVALLVSLTAVNSAISFTAAQRQGVGAVGSALNSAAVLSALKDDVAVAGLGFFGDSTYLCNTLNFSANSTVVANGTAFSPLQVNRTAAGDTIDTVFGTRVESGANVRLRAASNGTSSVLESYLPVAVGEAVLLAPAVPDNARPCMVRTVTQVVPSTAVSPQQLAFDATGLHNVVVFATNPGFTDESRITQLGALNWSRYRVVGGNLVLERPLQNTQAIIARNVISFRMQYGVSASAGNDTLQAWVDPAVGPLGDFSSLNATNLPQVRAVRIGLIVRSPQPEKRDAAGNCVATVTKPALWGATPENLGNADWACWRYRTSSAVVPMRNLVLGQQ